MKRAYYAYLLARLPMGMDFFGHGAIRLTKLATFSDGMVKSFNKSLLPEAIVVPFSYGLPFLELLTGILLLLGLFSRFAIVLGSIIILVLIFGCSVIEQWNAVFTQLLYGAYFALLYYFEVYNKYSIDGLRE
jgi:thiosulfate dehydrogenase [quinone] large subunit